ncbi:MAG: hypothetical protein QOG38_514, partial [Hyphomicrobiales bacterium]|nr:hypothetical protein [Hyphomicrobiales bacterium]
MDPGFRASRSAGMTTRDRRQRKTNTMATLNLPTKDRSFAPYTTGEPTVLPHNGAAPHFNRVAYAAAHVVADPLADNDPWLDAAVDWDKTIAFREYLWDLGLGVAEAMDTAQRGMGLDWNGAKELIRRALEAAKARPGVKIACGAGTDHLDANARVTLDDIIRAYEEQIEAIEGMGGQLIVMASRALARAAQSPEDYARVYGRILRQVKQPVIIHWLGEMFDPALAGYWGNADHMAAMDTCLGVLKEHAAKIDGVKISLLSKDKEIAMRRRLPAGVRMYTGDDFNYAELIAGDEHGYSDALLGIFDSIAPAASQALSFLSENQDSKYHEVLAPTVPLSRHIFKAPTRFYKTGVVFMAWLNGHQD